MIIVHIGLPKTATTYLQYKVFRAAFEDRYFHWRESKLVRQIRRVVQERMATTQPVMRDVVEQLRQLPAGSKSCMLTCENISSQSDGFWSGKGPSPKEVGESLRKLQEQADVCSSNFRLVVGVRRQDQMLASRYAQRASQGAICSQEDFEEKVEWIIRNGLELPGHQWLYYHRAKQQLDELFSPAQIYWYSQESLLKEPKRVLENMAEFCQTPFYMPDQEKNEEKAISFVNKKGVAENTWTLGKDHSPLKLRNSVRDSILCNFGEDNERFCMDTGCFL